MPWLIITLKEHLEANHIIPRRIHSNLGAFGACITSRTSFLSLKINGPDCSLVIQGHNKCMLGKENSINENICTSFYI